jgi:hypothetical protein
MAGRVVEAIGTAFSRSDRAGISWDRVELMQGVAEMTGAQCMCLEGG